jgi:hypothetical protein
MSTAQIVGAVAVAAVALVVVLVLLLRREPRHDADDTAVSFLDSAPQDTLHTLGRRDADHAGDMETAGDLRLTWGERGQDEDEITLGDRAGPAWPEGAPKDPMTAIPWPAGESDPIPAEGPAAGEPPPADEPPPAAALHAVAARQTSRDAQDEGERRRDPTRPPRMVPLSDVIVTTSGKLVDLDDPEVRRMLTELVRYEIDQAAEFSTTGQSVDAVLQLTEAEKVSRALGMDETAARIRDMMRELQA